MQRESVMPKSPENIADRDRANFKRHFEKRFEIESASFGELNYESTYSGIENSFAIQTRLIQKKLLSLLESNQVMSA
ncbi:MAG: hypothetical protein EBQ54_08030 [Actinobacteria bacterium]|nr:hypothetical protein [Actinomycetota bacterium]